MIGLFYFLVCLGIIGICCSLLLRAKMRNVSYPAVLQGEVNPDSGKPSACCLDILFARKACADESCCCNWLKVYPFYLGFYLYLVGIALALLTAMLGGAAVDYALNRLFGALMNFCAPFGCLCLIFGVRNIVVLRLKNEAKLPQAKQFLEAGLFALFAVSGLLTWLANPNFAQLATDVVANLFSGNWVSVGSGGIVVHILLGLLLLVLIPIRLDGHFLAAYLQAPAQQACSTKDRILVL